MSCMVCKHKVDENGCCSAFCAEVTDAERKEFVNAKPGDFCFYPCPECGCTMEDEWRPEDPRGSMCSDCNKKLTLQERTVLLNQVRDFLVSMTDTNRTPAFDEMSVRASEFIGEIDKILK